MSASVTVEAAMAVPIFFLAVICLIYLLELMAIGTAVRSGLQYAGKRAAQEAATAPVLMPSRLEADVVLHLADGRYALIECKLGSREIEDGAKHLLEIKRLVQERNRSEKQMPIREPDLMIVITGGEFAYRREDGVYVIPLGCLKN